MSNSRAYEKGYDAYYDGLGCEDNPYNANGVEFSDWEDGWSSAYNEDNEGDYENDVDNDYL